MPKIDVKRAREALRQAEQSAGGVPLEPLPPENNGCAVVAAICVGAVLILTALIKFGDVTNAPASTNALSKDGAKIMAFVSPPQQPPSEPSVELIKPAQSPQPAINDFSFAESQLRDAITKIGQTTPTPTPPTPLPTPPRLNLQVVNVKSYDTLNVREGPSQNTRVVARTTNGYKMLKLGDAVSNDEDLWIPVQLANIRGYVNSKFLKSAGEATPGGLRERFAPRHSTMRNFKNPMSYPIATGVAGRPGLVISPYAPRAGYVNVRGFPSGSKVQCPYTGSFFLVP